MPLAYLSSAVFLNDSADKIPVNISRLTATLDAWGQSEDFSVQKRATVGISFY